MSWTTLARWLALLTVLAVVVAAGCMKRSAGASSYGYGSAEATAAPGDYGGGYDEGYGGSSGGDGYDFEADSVEGEMLSPEGANMASRGRSSAGSMMDVRQDFKREEAPPAEPSPQPQAPPQPEPVDTPTAEPPRDAPKSVASKRQIIYTATMQVSVYDVAGSIEIAESLPDRFGGWLHQRNDNQLILRIPAEHLDAAMAVIAELGIVDYRLLEALDVTAEYTDLESRIRVLTEIQAQLKLLLTQAKTVEQALEIRRALDQVTLELELARTRMRELAKSIAFSTLILRFVARGPIVDVPSSNDPFPWVLELGVEATEYR